MHIRRKHVKTRADFGSEIAKRIPLQMTTYRKIRVIFTNWILKHQVLEGKQRNALPKYRWPEIEVLSAKA